MTALWIGIAFILGANLETIIVGNYYDKVEEKCEKYKKVLYKIKKLVKTCLSKVACFECEHSEECCLIDEDVTYDVCKPILKMISEVKDA